MKQFLREYGGTILLVAILVILLAPYLGIRFGIEAAQTPALPIRTRPGAETIVERSREESPRETPSKGVATTPSDQALGEIEALLKK